MLVDLPLGVVADHTGIDKPGDIQALRAELRHGCRLLVVNDLPVVMDEVSSSRIIGLSGLGKIDLAWRKVASLLGLAYIKYHDS